jgi:hypothetical protein
MAFKWCVFSLVKKKKERKLLNMCALSTWISKWIYMVWTKYQVFKLLMHKNKDI